MFGVGPGRQRVESSIGCPEAHTDFLLAVIGEEFGLAGVIAVILPFLWMTRRIISFIGRRAIALDRVFAGPVAQGGHLIGFQAFINMRQPGRAADQGAGPLMSYGGSAILMNMIAIGCANRLREQNDDAGRETMSRLARPGHGDRHGEGARHAALARARDSPEAII